jgi:uncharacterized protein YcbK (DUF882 family)
MTRRELLFSLLAGAVSCAAFPDVTWGAKTRKWLLKSHVEERRKELFERTVPVEKAKGLYTGQLYVVRRDTQESLKLRYLNAKGEMDPSAWSRLNNFFRCPQTGKETVMSPSLFLLLDGVHRRLEAKERPFELFSGYRSPSYNRSLSRRDRHVARNSYHMRGMAADLALKDVRLSEIRDAARDFCGGGIGSYSDFVHLDVGPVRCW